MPIVIRLDADETADPTGNYPIKLESVGERVNALSSADSERWITVGHAKFSFDDPVQVSVHASGNIDRTVYHGAYSDDTATCFESFQLWSD